MGQVTESLTFDMILLEVNTCIPGSLYEDIVLLPVTELPKLTMPKTRWKFLSI